MDILINQTAATTDRRARLHRTPLPMRSHTCIPCCTPMRGGNSHNRPTHQSLLYKPPSHGGEQARDPQHLHGYALHESTRARALGARRRSGARRPARADHLETHGHGTNTRCAWPMHVADARREPRVCALPCDGGARAQHIRVCARVARRIARRIVRLHARLKSAVEELLAQRGDLALGLLVRVRARRGVGREGRVAHRRQLAGRPCDRLARGGIGRHRRRPQAA